VIRALPSRERRKHGVRAEVSRVGRSRHDADDRRHLPVGHFLHAHLELRAVRSERAHQAPLSELAKPSASLLKTAIMVQVTDQGTVIMGGDEVQIPGFAAILRREKAAILADKSKSLADATILIRADKFTQTGKVQEVIKAAKRTNSRNSCSGPEANAARSGACK